MDQQPGVEFYIRSPQGFEMAYRRSGEWDVADVYELAQALLEAGFERSERLNPAPRGGGGNPNWKPKPVPVDEHGEKIVCGKCGGDVYDNREENAERRAKGQQERPDFACKDKVNCKWIKWPERERRNGKPDANPFDTEPDPIAQLQ